MIKEITLLIYNAIVNSNFNNDLRVYAFTNENIASYLKEIDTKEVKKVLSVLSSGDHLFNLLLLLDVKQVDLIDINLLSEYYLSVRLAMIKSSNLKEYQDLLYYFFKSHDYNLDKEKNIWNSILKNMNLKYQEFFKVILEYYFKLQSIYKKDIRLLQILTKDYYYNLDELLFYNEYLKDENKFLTLKKKLDETILSFRNGNIFDITSNNYDLILCSNILEYTLNNNSLKDLYNNFKNLRESLNENGLIFASYIYNFINRNGEYLEFPINGVDISYRELLREELILIDNYKRGKDAVLVLRK